MIGEAIAKTPVALPEPRWDAAVNTRASRKGLVGSVITSPATLIWNNEVRKELLVSFPSAISSDRLPFRYLSLMILASSLVKL